MHEIYYATSNPMKFEEARHYFERYLPHISLKNYAEEIPEIQTLDQKLIAINKAREAWNRLQKPVLAEDAGIYFCRYNDFPGTLTKFIYQALGMKGLLKLVKTKDEALFRLHLVYYYGTDKYHVFKSECAGTIFKTKIFKAPKAIPFDDIFVPKGSTKTYSQLRSRNLLTQFNYRAKALALFNHWYHKTYTI